MGSFRGKRLKFRRSDSTITTTIVEDDGENDDSNEREGLMGVLEGGRKRMPGFLQYQLLEELAIKLGVDVGEVIQFIMDHRREITNSL